MVYTVAGGRSRLHLIDFGSGSRGSKDPAAMTLSAMGNVILALLSGQRHIPHKYVQFQIKQLILLHTHSNC